MPVSKWYTGFHSRLKAKAHVNVSGSQETNRIDSKGTCLSKYKSQKHKSSSPDPPAIDRPTYSFFAISLFARNVCPHWNSIEDVRTE